MEWKPHGLNNNKDTKPLMSALLCLMVLTNDKRGGLRVILFDRPPFDCYRGNFQKILCRPHPVRGIKPLSEHLFLLFANNYWFPITLSCLAATHFWHRKLYWNIGIVHHPRYLRWREKSALCNKSSQITLTIHATFGVAAKVLHRYL